MSYRFVAHFIYIQLHNNELQFNFDCFFFGFFLYSRLFGLFENHFATPLGIGLDNKLDSNVGSDYLGRKYIYRTPQRWKMLRKNFTALLMDG